MMSPRSATSRRRLFAAAASMGVLASLAACASLAGIDQYKVGPCKGGDPCADEEAGPGNRNDGGSDRDSDVGPLPGIECPVGAPGPTMVVVGQEGNQFCIDSTEVTVAQYKEFSPGSNPNAADQPSECQWNTSFAPGTGGSPPADDTPQVYVDWCDALAYCKWAGKRLCGKIVDGQYPGTPLAKSDLASTETDQWYIACSANGEKAYGYSNTFESGACNLNVTGPQGPKKAGSFPQCVGGSDGLHDMVGNVWEWIDLCVDADAGPLPENKVCYSRGGSFGTAEKDAKCDFNGTLARRSGKNDQIGIRCCSP